MYQKKLPFDSRRSSPEISQFDLWEYSLFSLLTPVDFFCQMKIFEIF